MRHAWIFAGIGAALAVAGYRAWRVAPLRQIPIARPEQTYDAALRRYRRLQAEDDDRVQPVCRTRLLTHGHKTRRAVVLLHGFTNCPAQYVELADRLYRRGDNVLIPRLPCHGFARLSDDSRGMTVENLIAVTADAIDIARGLGEQVTVFGLSMGGVLGIWAALHRPDVDHVVVASPALGTQAFPGEARARLAATYMLTAPNFFRWWDDDLRDDIPNPPHQYSRLSSRAFGQLLRLGLLVRREALTGQPVVKRCTFILNPADDAVDNDIAARVIAGWEKIGGSHTVDVAVYSFPEQMALLHDLIDPAQSGQQTARVYPVLLDLM